MLPATGDRDYRYHVVQLNPSARQDARKQVAAVLSLVCLGLCAAVFVASAVGSDSGDEDNILNAYAGPQIDLLQKPGRKTQLGLLGEGMEKDLNHDIATAFATFSKSSNETVKAMTTEFDPKAEEEKVASYITDIKDLYGETAQEAKILKDFAKPEAPKHRR